MSGHGFSETDQYLANHADMKRILKQGVTPEKVDDLFDGEQIQYLVMQEGTRREKQHRYESIEALYEVLHNEIEQPDSRFRPFFTATDRQGGVLRVFEIAPRQ